VRLRSTRNKRRFTPVALCQAEWIDGGGGGLCYGSTFTFAYIEEYICYLLGEKSFCTDLLVLLLLMSLGYGLPWLDLVI
jgi:hypothetical protein